MDKISNCQRHSRTTEIYCEACKNYLCVECLSTHENDCPKAQYVHIFKRAEQYALPTLDRLISEVAGTDQEIYKEGEKFMASLAEIGPDLKRVSKEHLQTVQVLKGLVTQLDAHIGPISRQPISEQMRSGLTSDKRRLEKALEDDNLEAIITLTKKILGEAEVTKKDNLEHDLIPKIKSLLASSQYKPVYKELNDTLGTISAKYNRLRLTGYSTEWKCDTKYLTSKMSLSPDGLVYGNTAGNGYPAIIADTLIEGGMCLFEVIPDGLNCTGKEGFGIIDIEKYKQCFKSDPTTPVAYNDMIGFLYSDEARGMKVVKTRSMAMGQKYYVKVDMINYKMEIKGPGAYFTAELSPETVYVPCFSCGCTGNKITIKPLGMEGEELMEKCE